MAAGGFTFLTNHAHALLCIARQPGARLRDIADCVGISDRAAHMIVSDLVEHGYLVRHRVGRRNFYEVHVDAPLRHPMDEGRTVGELLRPLLAPAADEAA